MSLEIKKTQLEWGILNCRRWGKLIVAHQSWSARQILTAYSYRWAIECTFENCEQLFGLEDSANRLPKAVERTALIVLFLYSLNCGVVP